MFSLYKIIKFESYVKSFKYCSYNFTTFIVIECKPYSIIGGVNIYLLSIYDIEANCYFEKYVSHHVINKDKVMYRTLTDVWSFFSFEKQTCIVPKNIYTSDLSHPTIDNNQMIYDNHILLVNQNHVALLRDNKVLRRYYSAFDERISYSFIFDSFCNVKQLSYSIVIEFEQQSQHLWGLAYEKSLLLDLLRCKNVILEDESLLKIVIRSIIMEDTSLRFRIALASIKEENI
jgi:hypothetical protein